MQQTKKSSNYSRLKALQASSDASVAFCLAFSSWRNRSMSPAKAASYVNKNTIMGSVLVIGLIMDPKMKQRKQGFVCDRMSIIRYKV
jgi:hypothetical protein